MLGLDGGFFAQVGVLRSYVLKVIIKLTLIKRESFFPNDKRMP